MWSDLPNRYPGPLLGIYLIYLGTFFGQKNHLDGEDGRHTFVVQTAQLSVSLVFCACLPFCLRPAGKASGKFPFIWWRRRRRPRYSVQKVVFVGGPLLETVVPLGSEGGGDHFLTTRMFVVPFFRLLSIFGCLPFRVPKILAGGFP